jgi:hypothetical protein
LAQLVAELASKFGVENLLAFVTMTGLSLSQIDWGRGRLPQALSHFGYVSTERLGDLWITTPSHTPAPSTPSWAFRLLECFWL